MSEDKLKDAIDAHEASRQLGYEMGSRQAWLRILTTALGQLLPNQEPTPELTIAKLAHERTETLLALQELCDDMGVDFEKDLHPADLIRKRIMRALEDARSVDDADPK